MTALVLTKELDEVLYFTSQNTTWQDVRNKFPTIPKEQMRTLVRKLQRDNLVDVIRKDKKVVAYDDYAGFVNEWLIRRNFDGELLVANGGYTNKEIIDVKNEKRKDHRELHLLFGTWFVAFGAVSLVVWEMIKTFCLENH